MKKYVILLLTLILALSLASCGGGEDPSSLPESSVPSSSASELDLSEEIKEKATAFANAVKTNNVVMMETLGNAPVDTYGAWAQPAISDVSVSENEVTKVSGSFILKITVTDAGGVDIVSVGENLYLLTIEWDDDEGEYNFTFEKQ
ncbi:MAG: hypothetical protein IKA51_00100 [Clostridia bacterium]|nr:hypothetical protein [Clostridia bacterium]